MTTEQRLRQAADTIRKRAAAATPGPWRQHDTHLGQYGYAATVLSGEGNDTDLRAWLPSMSQQPWDEARNVWPDAAWIALMHPGVGEALAAWLDAEAAIYEAVETTAAEMGPQGLKVSVGLSTHDQALALADQILDTPTEGGVR